ncbi:unnamed protein product [Linum trigynum]|uniref:F-box domain-containing protein n=1 Tax=Linum trigynum TaxID=586398 RepID=A0AAV2DQB2_9ROSI
MITGGGSSHCPTCTCRKKALIINGDDDRFSELPDHLLRSILSLLDSKLAVQTCALSPRWRSVWKGVPALNLDTKSFNDTDEFDQFVSEFISRRHDSAPIHEISIEKDTNRDGRRIEYDINESCGELFAYAASHGIRRLRAVEVLVDGFSYYVYDQGFLPLAPGFRMLTTLHLQRTKLFCPEPLVEPFSGFPNLRDLTLKDCYWANDEWDGEDRDICLRICGNQLLNLRIEGSDDDVSMVEIFAPNLESFVSYETYQSPDFGEFDLPSLDRVYVGFRAYGFTDGRDYRFATHLVNLLRRLHRASTLVLNYDTVEVLVRYPSLLVVLSPFTQLRILILETEPFDVSHMKSFFFGNPKNKGNKSTKFKDSSLVSCNDPIKGE